MECLRGQAYVRIIVATAIPKSVRELQRYLNKLRESGAPPPCRSRAPDKVATARICGFFRNGLNDSAEAVAVQHAFDAEEWRRRLIENRDDINDLGLYLENLAETDQRLLWAVKGQQKKLSTAETFSVYKKVLCIETEAMAVLDAFDDAERKFCAFYLSTTAPTMLLPSFVWNSI